MSEVALRVAIRGREIFERERKTGSIEVLVIKGNDVIITDDRQKKFQFDYTFDSRSSNESVWSGPGIAAFNDFWDGYNATLLAYGQTGAGKSHTMFGTPKDEGLIYKSVKEAFQKILIIERSSTKTKFNVEVSMIEVYNEKCYDLLNPTEFPLQVMTNPFGTFVPAARRARVNSYDDFKSMMEKALRARAIRHTEKCITSNRAHVLFYLILTNLQTNVTTKFILGDLAGSERVGMSIKGDSLSGVSKINKSIIGLNNVVTALSNRLKLQGPKKKKFPIPYKESLLTRLLQDSFGGTASTSVIACVKIDNANIEESLATLKTVVKMKKIKNQLKKVAPESDDMLVKELQNFNNQLKVKISELLDDALPDSKQAQELSLLKEQVEDTRKLIISLQMSDREKTKREHEAQKNLDAFGLQMNPEIIHHAVLLCRDPLLSERALYFIPEGEYTVFGSKRSNTRADIYVRLQAPLIQEEHCLFEGLKSQVSVTPSSSDALVYVNGKRFNCKTLLQHGDRVRLGLNIYLRYCNPDEDRKITQRCEKENLPKPKYKDYYDAVREIVENENMIPESKSAKAISEKAEKFKIEVEMGKQNQLNGIERLRIKLNSQKRQTQMEIAEIEEEIQLLKKKLAERGKDSNERLVDLEKQLNLRRQAIKAEEERVNNLIKRKQKDLADWLKIQQKQEQYFIDRQIARVSMEDKILELAPLIQEANMMAKLMGRNMEYSIEIIDERGHTFDEDQEKLGVGVNAYDRENDQVYFWPYEKFCTRLFLMRDVFQGCQEMGKDFEIKLEEDPFYDNVTVTPQIIGIASVSLKPISHQIEVQANAPILDTRGNKQGTIQFGIFPCDSAGNIDNTEYFLEPEKSLGLPLHFKIIITSLKGLPKNKCAKVFCKFKFFNDQEWNKTPQSTDDDPDQDLKYEKMYSFPSITPELLNYLMKEDFQIHVFGCVPLRREKPNIGIVDELKEKIEALEKERDEIEKENHEMELRIEDLEQEKDEMASEKEALLKELKQLQQQGAEKLMELQQELARQSAALKRQIEYEKEKARKELEAMDNKFFQLEQEKKMKEMELERLKQEMELERQRAQEEERKAREQWEQKAKEAEEAKNRLSEIESKLKKIGIDPENPKTKGCTIQ